ncbi:UNVERIFIED_CONTAM: hypothetical protein Sangu_2978400 [Sesamum angustifolium]|uniref:DUF4283 domain-containing protein n=1 Tax=Sesamum angustifolium TaxID=2727405 RepID=A0AAW2IK45_9LAMI
MDEIIEGGPWLFQGQPIFLQRWEPGMTLQKQEHKQVSVWVKLKNLLVEYWINEGLSLVASEIGQLLYQDAITRKCTRIDYARKGAGVARVRCRWNSNGCRVHAMNVKLLVIPRRNVH